MVNERNNAKEALIALRNRFLREMVESSSRAEREARLVDFYTIDRAIADAHPTIAPMKYTGYKRAINAILDYLDEVGDPVEKEALVDVIEKRGFRALGKEARPSILKSLASYTSGEAGRKKRVIKLINGRFGRGEWEEARFK